MEDHDHFDTSKYVPMAVDEMDEHVTALMTMIALPFSAKIYGKDDDGPEPEVHCQLNVDLKLAAIDGAVRIICENMTFNQHKDDELRKQIERLISKLGTLAKGRKPDDIIGRVTVVSGLALKKRLM